MRGLILRFIIQSTVTFETIQNKHGDTLVVTKLWIATPEFPALVAPETQVRKDDFVVPHHKNTKLWTSPSPEF